MTTPRRPQPETVTVKIGFGGRARFKVTAEVVFDEEAPDGYWVDRLLLHTKDDQRPLVNLHDEHREAICAAVDEILTSYGTDQRQQADHDAS